MLVGRRDELPATPVRHHARRRERREGGRITACLRPFRASSRRSPGSSKRSPARDLRAARVLTGRRSRRECAPADPCTPRDCWRSRWCRTGSGFGCEPAGIDLRPAVRPSGGRGSAEVTESTVGLVLRPIRTEHAESGQDPSPGRALRRSSRPPQRPRPRLADLRRSAGSVSPSGAYAASELPLSR